MAETNKTYVTKINNVDHRTFGGIIEESDFITDFVGNSCQSSSIASRITRDWAFDRQCIKDAENRDRNAEYKKEHLLFQKQTTDILIKQNRLLRFQISKKYI